MSETLDIEEGDWVVRLPGRHIQNGDPLPTTAEIKTALAIDAGDDAAQAAAEATAAAALSAHTGAADPHPGYLTPAEGNAAYDATGAAAAAVVTAAADATAKVAAEAVLARNADNLSSGTVADARIASTIARDSEVTSAVSTHAGATDPHGDRAFTTSAVSTHEADTTSVHGIADTSALETTTGSQSKADAKVSDTAYAGSWDGVTSVAPSKNAVYDQVELKAPLASPALTGNPTAPTQTAANNSTRLATTAYVDTADALKANLASPTFTGSPVVPGYLPLLSAGAAVENIGAVESNVNTVAATGSTETLDTSVYGVHDCTMDQACTFTFSNPAPSGKNTTFVLVLRGAFTPTLPASVKWSSGSVPTYTTPSVYVFTTVDAGTTYYAQQVGKAFA